ncbi:MAG: 4Fe-4S binding protein [Thermoleophilia bacterium]
MAEGTKANELCAKLHAVAMAGGFVGCGAVSRHSFAGAPAGLEPERIIAGYRSVLVLAAPPDRVITSGPCGPALLDEALSEALAAIRVLLGEAGYQVRPVVSGDVSLPRAAAAAGLGEVSPVGALVAEKYGLSLTLVGLVTDAPLPPSPRQLDSAGVCRECGRCTEDCPATLPGSFDFSWCTGCGVCVAVCPLGSGQC